MKILFNNVLVKIDPVDRITLAGGFELFMDNRFEEQKNAPQSGIVVQLPEKLVFSHDPEQRDTIEYDVDNELQVGDRVVFNYLAEHHARQNGLVFDDCIPVIYDKIYLAIRNDQIIPVNGTVLVVPESELIQSHIILPDSFDRTMKTFGTVLAAGVPHRQRRFFNENAPAYPFYLDSEGFKAVTHYSKAGDKVFFNKINAIPLQHNSDLHGVVSKKLIYRMKHDDIECIVDPEVQLEVFYVK